MSNLELQLENEKVIKQTKLIAIDQYVSNRNYEEMPTFQLVLNNIMGYMENTTYNRDIELYKDMTPTKVVEIMVAILKQAMLHPEETKIQVIGSGVIPTIGVEHPEDGIYIFGNIIFLMKDKLIEINKSELTGEHYVSSKILLPKELDYPTHYPMPIVHGHKYKTMYVNPMLKAKGYTKPSTTILDILSKVKLSLIPQITRLPFPKPDYKELQDENDWGTFLSQRNNVIRCMAQAGNKFSYLYVCDGRGGRYYSKGYHLNPQGTEANKASHQFFRKEYLNDNGLEALKIAIAGAYSKPISKSTLDIRLKWFEANEHQLDALIGSAEDKYLFYKYILGYQDHLKGLPIGTSIPFDDTASVAQYIGLLTRGTEELLATNLVGDNSEMLDTWTEVYKKLLELLDTTEEEFPISRKEVKEAATQTFYDGEARAKEVLGEDTIELQMFYKALQVMMPNAWAYIQLMHNLNSEYVIDYNLYTPHGWWEKPLTNQAKYAIKQLGTDPSYSKHNRKALNLPEPILSIEEYIKAYDAIDNTMDNHMWDAPRFEDGKQVWDARFRNKPTTAQITVNINSVETGYPSFTYQYSFNEPYAYIDSRAAKFNAEIVSKSPPKGMGANMTHCVESACLGRAIYLANLEGIDCYPVHDEIWVSPNNSKRMLSLYNQAKQELHDSNTLSRMVSQLGGEYTHVRPVGCNDVTKSVYACC